MRTQANGISTPLEGQPPQGQSQLIDLPFYVHGSQLARLLTGTGTRFALRATTSIR